ncbi:MAG: hypothetical protein AAGB34_09630, partial [Planctomycetota bacterium]
GHHAPEAGLHRLIGLNGPCQPRAAEPYEGKLAGIASFRDGAKGAFDSTRTVCLGNAALG